MTSVAYIGGLGRSGSTLLERIAGRFDGVCVLGEVVHLWERGIRRDELCSCGEAFSRCPFWRAVGDTAFGGWHNVDVDRLEELAGLVDRTRYVPASLTGVESRRRQAHRAEYGAHFRAVYAAAAELTSARIVVDSSKHPSAAFVLRRVAGIELRVVHIVRDSRGVAYSWTKLIQRPEAGAGNAQPVMHQYPPWRAALLWDTHNLAFAALGRSGVPVWRLHYERLLADPPGSARLLADFLGVPGQSIDDFVSRDHVSIGPAHQIAGNHMRFQTGTVPLRADDQWRESLPDGSRRVVTALTAPLMVGYGYRIGGGGKA